MYEKSFLYTNPDELIQWLRHHSLMINLDRCTKICVPNKTENVDVKVFNMITGINETKTFTKDVSCDWNCKFDSKKNVIKTINGMEISANISAKYEWTIVYLK